MAKEKWLEFRVENEECKHEQDQYDGCPLCEIAELKEENKMLRENNERLTKWLQDKEGD